MRLRFIPFHACGNHCTGQDRLTECNPAQCGGVETAEWMERIALYLRAFDGLIQKAEIEVRVMANQYRATATVLTHRATYLAKYSL